MPIINKKNENDMDNEQLDPVCGMTVTADAKLHLIHKGIT